jgi:hypothetical protein
MLQDQYAFRPTGSTSAAIILVRDSHLLADNPFVAIIAHDNGTIRHATLANKLADPSIPDYAYNRLSNFFDHGSHSTDYNRVIDYQQLRIHGVHFLSASAVKLAT